MRVRARVAPRRTPSVGSSPSTSPAAVAASRPRKWRNQRSASP